MDHTAEVEGIAVGVGSDGANVPAVVLSARNEYLPIFVTADQAQAIQIGLSGESFERPLTHDLLVEMVNELGGAIDSVRIDALADNTFYAKIDAEQYEDGEAREFVLDARPSDAVALAVRVDCPIVVSDQILDTAGRPPSALDLSSSGTNGPSDDDSDWRI